MLKRSGICCDSILADQKKGIVKHMSTPQNLIARCQQGDTHAYTRLYEQHARYVYNAICRYVDHTGEAEDLLLETFVEAYHAIGKLQDAERFGPWVKRIGINKAISSLRRRRLQLTELDADHTVMNEEATVDEEDFEYTMSRVNQAIAELPLGYRTVFQLHAVEHIPLVEIAELLGMAASTARVQYLRARTKILDMLKEGLYER